MTLSELETLVKQIQAQVELNTTAISTLNSRFNAYATLSALYSTNNTVANNTSAISSMQSAIANLQTSIGLVNRIGKLLDVNIQGLAKDDLLQYDGDRWTNIKPSKLGVSDGTGNMSLENLSDVSISNKTDGQSLVWSNSQNKWVNSTVSGGSGGGLDVTAMWEALASYGTQQINPSHITGSLSLAGLTVNGSTTLKNSNTQLNVTTSQVTVNGNIIGTGEITAYSV